MTYETLLNNIRQNTGSFFESRSAYSDNSNSGTLSFSKEQNNFYRPEKPYYLQTEVFTGNDGDTITGLSLHVDNGLLPSKKILGIAESENDLIFDIIGFNEIDKRQAKIYIENHNPKYQFIEPIQEFKLREDFPEELYNLDILDGSPPCSSFSVSGNREKDWGKNKKFREGQIDQVLDTLFFDFIELGKKLQPKIIIAENVKGILLGEAKKYVREILKSFDDAGYVVNEFLLNANRMGVPQSRERVFFVAVRKDLVAKLPENDALLFNDFPILDLVFFEDFIPFEKIMDDFNESEITEGTKLRTLWENRQYGDADLGNVCMRLYGKDSFFNHTFCYKNKVLPTILSDAYNVLFDQPRRLNKNEILRASSFPLDYKFLTKSPVYECGMSVPPVMMAQVISRIYEQWITKF